MIEQIEKQAIHLAELALHRDRARDELQQIEDAITTEVLAERDSSGKPAYSNETSRAIAIRQKCRELGRWRQTKDELDGLDLAKATEAARLEAYRNQFSKWKLEYRRATAEMEAAKE